MVGLGLGFSVTRQMLGLGFRVTKLRVGSQEHEGTCDSEEEEEEEEESVA